MSINVQLHADVVPYLVSPYESFFFLMDHVKLTVESGSGYPGEGGCFYGHTGRCYVSQYRVVVVSDPNVRTAYRSFSLPFYCIRDWSFSVGWLGAQTWRGHVNPVPGGGLIGVGRFSLQFLSHGFEEFRRHLEPVLEGSRLLFQRFSRLEAPSVLLLPGKLPGQADDDGSKRIAYCAPTDPFTLYILADATTTETS
ncbi:hypothetical protein Poli38472_012217 [Pythium oligandrum]|uniref:Uncharacterized protein n=1 Tax=Pythium oligandrum TaxID=41045 RepID=A0A8K1CNW5_PYTOL|nr:hypothetical protein Poli38472_012217 [Pythium oligandrum]|eukprot:TMW67101.1 hypothetical protein Poli38472_012217 [Pythium oligandrum]